MQNKHWSKVQLLHEVVTNPNIIVKGQHSYYSDCWDAGFEGSAVRYLHGDEVSGSLSGLSINFISGTMCVSLPKL